MQKKIFVVLTRSRTTLSRIIHRVTRDEYTHAAIALDENLYYMFSFGRRRASNPFFGCFKRESLNDEIYEGCAGLPGVVLEIPVTPGQYDAICSMIELFLLDSHRYGYNTLGLAKNLIGLPGENNARFFCSEFVYYVLRESGVCDLGVSRGGVRPQMLLNVDGRVIFDGNLLLLRRKMTTPQTHRRFLSFG
jgi:hypothetical protein